MKEIIIKLGLESSVNIDLLFTKIVVVNEKIH